MARIRTIKPEFFTSEDIVSLTPLARLLYIALWCEGDREGRLLWKPRTFKMRYLPADVCDVEALCHELVAAKLVKLYGDGHAYIPKFQQHQHLNPREAASKLPDPHAARTRRARVDEATVIAEGRDSDAQGVREGKGKEGDTDPSLAGDGHEEPPLVLIPLNGGSNHGITAAMVAEWSSTFPAVDVPQQLRQMRAWCIVNPAKKKTARGVGAFIVKWLSREQDQGGTLPRGKREPPGDIFDGAH